MRLIGGTTDWDMSLPALQAIMAEWDRPLPTAGPIFWGTRTPWD
jgi:hypothetical protein